MRLMLDKRTLAYIFVFLLGIAFSSAIWTIYQYLSYRNISKAVSYDYIIYGDSKNIIVKNGLTGVIDFIGKNLSDAIYSVLEKKKENLSILIKSGQYYIPSDILLENLISLKIVGEGAELHFNGGSIILRGENYEKSMNNLIEGLTLVNGSMIVENSFMTTIKKCIFEDSDAGVILMNTNTWTECTLIEDCHFENVKKCIVFKTPILNGTESYANTEIKRCNFRLIGEGSVAIHVEAGANFNEGIIQNVRIWMGNANEANYTGILIEGSMLNTVLQNVVFESFANSPSEIYGMKIGPACEPPLLGQGVVFLGNLTKNIDNPFGKWVYGIGCSFKFENIGVPIGLNNLYGNSCEITPPKYLHFSMPTVHLKIRVEGDFSENETITVRLRLKFIDGSYSKDLAKTFNANATIWLDHDDLFSIWPTLNIISSLVLDAKTNMSSSNVRVYASIYGQYN